MSEQTAQKRISDQDRALLSSLPIEVLTSLTAGTTDTGVSPSTDKGEAAAITGRSGHRMRVRLLEATGLPATTYFATNKSDTYAILGLQGSKTRVTSRVVRETTSPVYNEAWDFHLSPRPQEDILYLTLYACHTIGRDDFLGRVEIPLSMILAMPSPRKLECWFKLLPESSHFYVNDKTGSIRLGLEYFFDPNEGQLMLLRHQALAFAQIDAGRGRLPSPPFAPLAVPSPLPSSSSGVMVESGPHSPPGVPYAYSGYPTDRHTYHPAFSPQSYPTTPLLAQQPPTTEPQEPCAVCNQPIPASRLAAHVESHFAGQSSRGGQPTEVKTIVPPPARYQPTVPPPTSGPYPLGYPPLAAPPGAGHYSFPTPPTPLPMSGLPSATAPPPAYASLRIPPRAPMTPVYPVTEQKQQTQTQTEPERGANTAETISEREARELAQALRESQEIAQDQSHSRGATSMDPNLTHHETQLLESLSQRLAQQPPADQSPIHEASPTTSMMAGWNPAPSQRLVPHAALYPSVSIPLSYPTQPSH